MISNPFDWPSTGTKDAVHLHAAIWPHARRKFMTKRISTLLAILAAAAFAVACAQTDVDTKDKVVTLSGNVDSQAAKDQAVALARGTEGVADVVDNITLKTAAAANPPAGNPPAGGEGALVGGNAPNPEPNRPMGQVMDDAAITAAVKAKLLADPTVGGLKIDVDTRNGVVYLTSEHMKSQAEIDQAIKLAKETSGVKDVQSKLTMSEKAEKKAEKKGY